MCPFAQLVFGDGVLACGGALSLAWPIFDHHRRGEAEVEQQNPCCPGGDDTEFGHAPSSLARKQGVVKFENLSI